MDWLQQAGSDCALPCFVFQSANSLSRCVRRSTLSLTAAYGFGLSFMAYAGTCNIPTAANTPIPDITTTSVNAIPSTQLSHFFSG